METAQRDRTGTGGRPGLWRRLTRRRPLPSVALAGTAVLLVAGVVLPAPYVIEAAGPTFNTVGTHDDRQLVKIDGATTYPSDGQLDLTTVYVRGGPSGRINSINAVLGWLNPSEAVVPQDTLYPPETTRQDVADSNAAAMTTSQEDSVAAALGYLHRPYRTTLTVHAVVPGGAAGATLRAGDEIAAVDGTRVTSLKQLRSLLDAAGSRGADVTVRHGGGTRTEHVALTRDEETGSWQLGVYLVPRYDFPLTVDFQLEQVGGPSAGMMFALGIVEELTPGSLAGDEHIAGTGTITADGDVGPIGGIRQKLEGAAESGARYFLAPAQNCDEVTGHVPDGLTVIEVGSLGEAVNAVEQAAAGNVTDLPSCETR
ncbi:YlbL family protein [Kocuria tytonis]|uniref:endopeptidase La n=1 Tax=Kocuria tytonis TaxID=2054280 RepID=A0A495AD72_9MICC|nr:S16 family serine protease [Kocuria tytonis]RKQ36725.1 PDZ domain-containing protein [Kocuria tytonis]